MGPPSTFQIDADGSNRGMRHSDNGSSDGRNASPAPLPAQASPSAGQSYEDAMQQEYFLELSNLEAGAVPPPPPAPTALDDAKVIIESRQPASWLPEWGAFPKKLKGGLDKRMPMPPLREIFWSFLGAFLGIFAVSAMDQFLSPEIDLPLLVASFGASAVLIFAVIESKLSQPRNFVGGQVISAIVGVVVRIVIHEPWIATPVGMSLSLVAMMLTSTTHPPGGATAIIVCAAAELPKWSGFSYVVTVLFGSTVMQVVALVVNNLAPGRQYPTYWW